MQKKIDSCKMFLKMADDLENSEPIIALCCRIYYVDKFLALKKQAGSPMTPEEQAELGKLLEVVEEGKKTLGMSKEEMKEALDEYCARNFVALDKEERTAVKITKDHAKRFSSMSHFIELLSVYGGMTPKWEELRRFVKSNLK